MKVSDWSFVLQVDHMGLCTFLRANHSLWQQYESSNDESLFEDFTVAYHILCFYIYSHK